MVVKSQLLALLAGIFVGCCQVGLLAAENSFAEGVKRYQAKDYKGAEKFFIEVHPTDTSFNLACLYKGYCQAAQGKYADARQSYNYVITNFAGSKSEAEAKQALKALPAVEAKGDGPADFDVDYEIVGAHFMVNSMVNGHKVRSMFDTGAENCVVTTKLAADLGINVPANAEQMRITGASGAGVMARVVNVPVVMGTLSRTVPMIVLPNGSLTEPLIGQEFIRGYQFKIDNRQRQFHMSRDGAVLQPKRVGVTTKGYSVPFVMQGNSLIVDVEVNRKPCKMIFDTGAFETTLGAYDAQALGLLSNVRATMVVSGADGSAPAGIVTLERFEFGPIVKTNVPVVVVLRGGPPIPLLSPKMFVNDRNYVIDQEKRVITFY